MKDSSLGWLGAVLVGWGRSRVAGVAAKRSPQQSAQQTVPPSQSPIVGPNVPMYDLLMRRRHRKNLNIPGHAHELTFSCYQQFPFLKSDLICNQLSKSIERARLELNFDLWAYVFMPEHVHLIVHPHQTRYDMADIRKAIKSPVGQYAIEHFSQHAPHWLTNITRQRGQRTERLFWQSGGGYDRNITEPKTLLRMIDYIHVNPVRRGLVGHASHWKWSSAAHFQGAGSSPVALDRIPPEWMS